MDEEIILIIVLALAAQFFGVKYFNKSDVEHLCASLREYYEISTDWEGKNYC